VANEKQPYILISLYESLYKERYNKMPRINKFREKWAMQDVIDSVGFDRAKELLVYYFKTNKSGHPLGFFFYNFDKIDYLKVEIEKDIKNRRTLREATKKLVEGGAE
jgi:D-alanyl-lipoteichoic acid acyltransferase DltB (MBOAT superfamily)